MGAKLKTDILIITALKQELESISSTFGIDLPSSKLPSEYPITYYSTSIDTIEGNISYRVVVMCLYDMGNSIAGIQTAIAVTELNPSCVIMFGLAGGIEQEVGLKDVVVANQIFYTGLGKHKEHGREIRLKSLDVDQAFLQSLRDFDTELFDTDKFNIHFGAFAIGEDVVASNEQRERILAVVRKAIGIEMESYGVGLATTFVNADARFIAIRGICDFADPNKKDVYRETALFNASNFLYSYLRAGRLPDEKIIVQPNYLAISHFSVVQSPSVVGSVNPSNDVPLNKIAEISINQFSTTSPAEALVVQNVALQQILGQINQNPSCKLGYFGLAYVPFTFHLGYKIFRRPIDLYGNDYLDASWYLLPEESQYPQAKVEGEGIPANRIHTVEDVILRFSVTHEVLPHLATEIIPEPVAHIHISASITGKNIIRSQSALNHYVQAFSDIVHKVTDRIPNARLHIFASIQPTLAFKCGQQITESHAPQIIVYNYSNLTTPKYAWGLHLQQGSIIET